MTRSKPKGYNDLSPITIETWREWDKEKEAAIETRRLLLSRCMHMLDLVQTEMMAENDNYLPLAQLNQLLIDLVKEIRDR